MACDANGSDQLKAPFPSVAVLGAFAGGGTSCAKEAVKKTVRHIIAVVANVILFMERSRARRLGTVQGVASLVPGRSTYHALLIFQTIILPAL